MHKVEELTDTQVALHEEPFGSCWFRDCFSGVADECAEMLGGRI